jgi:hypothetical protein
MLTNTSGPNAYLKRLPIALLSIVVVLLGTICGVQVAPAQAAPVRTAGAVSVMSYGAVGNGSSDDTAAFLRAQDAALSSSVRYASGPTGAPQAVVYVPPGTYRLLHLPFRSNLRMEVNASAVLEQAGGRYTDIARTASLIDWDAPGPTPLTNVSLVGVGTSSGGLKALAGRPFTGWSLSSDFTFNLDPGTTNASVLVAGVQALNVTGFLIMNVYSIQNDSQPLTLPTTDDGWWPGSRKAALGLRERADTPSDGSVFYDPHNGTITNWYNIGGPKGFGPNQVNAGHNLTFRHLFTQGGTAMRLETDASQGKTFASEIRGLIADDVAGLNCNRAVAFSPHAQFNYDVTVTRVQAVNCAAGVVESIDATSGQAPGAFVNSTISGVSVTGGLGAQNAPTNGNTLWTTGISQRAFAKDKSLQASWSVVYGTFSCQGVFLSPPQLIMSAGGLVAPVCL